MVKIASGILVLALTASVAPLARAADGDALRENRDRAQIEALMWQYVRALDTLNEEAYADAYTPDGQFGSTSNAAKGREALKKVVADIKKGRAEREAKGEPKSPPMYHVIANSYIEFIDKDHARFHSYWMTVFAGGGATAPPRVAAVGRGTDELVRLNGRWLIQSRNVAPQD
jgi:uncharacterized protein (TIGR02246 family)